MTDLTSMTDAELEKRRRLGWQELQAVFAPGSTVEVKRISATQAAEAARKAQKDHERFVKNHPEQFSYDGAIFRLTVQESQTAILLASGKSAVEAAESLSCSPSRILQRQRRTRQLLRHAAYKAGLFADAGNHEAQIQAAEEWSKTALRDAFNWQPITVS